MNPSLLAGDDVAARELLTRSGLPTADLMTAQPTLLGWWDEAVLIGVVGVESLGTIGLLRSLAVRADRRGTGLGGRLAAAAEGWAREQGIRELFLLTTTAERFFAARGYHVVARSAVPDAIQATSEFTTICPASAVVMHRILSHE